MARPCSVCSSAHLPAVSTDLVKGVGLAEVARRYGFTKSAVQRHRVHAGIAAAPVVQAQQRSAFTAFASLPSADEVGQAYSGIASRIDAIAAKAEHDGSLTVALMGLKELRSTVEAQAKLAGHIGSAASVQVNVQSNIDLGAAVKELLGAIGDRPPTKSLRRLELLAEADDE
jgi:hypothetical protein